MRQSPRDSAIAHGAPLGRPGCGAQPALLQVSLLLEEGGLGGPCFEKGVIVWGARENACVTHTECSGNWLVGLYKLGGGSYF